MTMTMENQQVPPLEHVHLYTLLNSLSTYFITTIYDGFTQSKTHPITPTRSLTFPITNPSHHHPYCFFFSFSPVAAASSSFVAGIGVKGWGGVGAGSGRPAPSATPASPRAKPVPPPSNSLSDFPTLGEAVGSSHHRTSSSGDLSVPPLPAATVGSGSGTAATTTTNFQQQEEENQQMGWSVRRPVATIGKDGMASSSSASSLGNANASSGSTDIFSAMAESPAMSTDYTFKPSEQTLKV